MITNILLTQGGHNKGYLPKDVPPPVTPTFATANLAVRLQTLREVGGFDERCPTGEDMDLGLRVGKTKWECYFEPRAIVRHKHRVTFAALLKQWFGYSFSHPYVLRKNTSKGIHVHWRHRNRTRWRGFHLRRFLGVAIPFHAFVYLSSFYLFHILCVLTAICFWRGFLSVGFLLGIATAHQSLGILSGKSYVGFPLRERISFIAIRYVLNWAYVIGGLIGGAKIGVLYLEAVREDEG